jgi:hypothetical protein
MQELLFGTLFGTWGPQIVAYAQQYPWRVFAAVLVAVLFIDLMFRKRSSGTGDWPELDFGGGDGDGGGD